MFKRIFLNGGMLGGNLDGATCKPYTLEPKKTKINQASLPQSLISASSLTMLPMPLTRQALGIGLWGSGRALHQDFLKDFVVGLFVGEPKILNWICRAVIGGQHRGLLKICG